MTEKPTLTAAQLKFLKELERFADGYDDGVLTGPEKRMVWRLMSQGLVHSARYNLKREIGFSYQITDAGRAAVGR